MIDCQLWGRLKKEHNYYYIVGICYVGIELLCIISSNSSSSSSSRPTTCIIQLYAKVLLYIMILLYHNSITVFYFQLFNCLLIVIASVGYVEQR